MLQYLTPTDPSQLNDAIHLFNEYASSLNISLAFQNFNEELNIINTNKHIRQIFDAYLHTLLTLFSKL